MEEVPPPGPLHGTLPYHRTWPDCGTPAVLGIPRGDDALRRALVQEGDYKVQVLLACGEPFFVDRAYECLPGGLACDFVERWTYDPGPFRMLRILTFRHGRVDRIEQVVRP